MTLAHNPLLTAAPMPKPLFSLGRVVATQGAIAALAAANADQLALLQRHVTGEWSEMPKEDQEQNVNNATGMDEEAGMVLSAFALEGNVQMWIITEADRSVTTFLLPSEY